MKSDIMRYQQDCLSKEQINKLKDDDTATFLTRLTGEFPENTNREGCLCSFDFKIKDNIARFINTKHYNLFMYNLFLCPIARLTNSDADKVRRGLVRQHEGPIKSLLPWRKEEDVSRDYRRHVEDRWQRIDRTSTSSQEIHDIWTQHKRNVHNIIFTELRVNSIQIGNTITFTRDDTVEFEVPQP